MSAATSNLIRKIGLVMLWCCSATQASSPWFGAALGSHPTPYKLIDHALAPDPSPQEDDSPASPRNGTPGKREPLRNPSPRELLVLRLSSVDLIGRAPRSAEPLHPAAGHVTHDTHTGAADVFSTASTLADDATDRSSRSTWLEFIARAIQTHAPPLP